MPFIKVSWMWTKILTLNSNVLEDFFANWVTKFDIIKLWEHYYKDQKAKTTQSIYIYPSY